MLKIFILFISVVNLFFSVQSQEQWYFNNIYNPENTYASGRSIIQFENNYYGICGTEILSANGLRLGLFKISATGELNTWKTIGENSQSYYAGSVGGTLIKTNDGNFAFACQVQDVNTVYGSLIKINPNLDTIWKKDFYTENDWTMAIKVKQCIDDKYIITGNVDPGEGYYYNALLLKTNSSGNELWHQTYGNELSEHGTDIIETPDGGYLIGGYQWNPPVYNSLDAMVIKTDSLGNEQWTQYYGNPNVDDDMAFVAMADDGNYLVATVYGVNSTSSSDRRGKFWIFKIDNNGEIITQKKIGDINRSEYMKNFRKTEDGYLASGFFVDSTFISYKGFLLKIDENLDSIWMRKYSHFNELYDYNLFYDASPTTDNGYIAIGQARPDQSGSTNKMWIVKVDSMGCDTAGCATGVQVFDFPEIIADGLSAYPNPVTEGEITFKFENTEYHNTMELKCFDIFGGEVHKEKVYRYQGESVVDVSGWNNGMYVAVVYINKTPSSFIKFIVNH